MKRVFDIVVASVTLCILSPFLAGVAVAIKREDGGPVLYSGLRIGQGGRPFRMHKFRSMVPNAHLLGGSTTSDNDPRLTRTERTLSKYKLDELPQLLNVI